MRIPIGTQNVILYCICRRTNVAVGPIYWFINGNQVNRTTASGINPYSRDNIPAPLIIPSFSATHVGTYGCAGFTNALSVTIDLAVLGTYCVNFIVYLCCDIIFSMTWFISVT